MDSVFEKITLYDILGYLFPGSVLMLLFLFGVDAKTVVGFFEKWNVGNGFMYLAFFLVSYLIGIALSELMTYVWKVGFGIYRRFSKGSNRNCKRVEEKYSPEEIADVLSKIGIKDEKEIIKSTIGVSFRERYMQYIYGVIQGKEEYKRIHNYASAYVLYKNVTGALMIGAVYILISMGRSHLLFCVVCILLAIIFAVRATRFQNKKEDYAIIWFMETALKDK